MPLSWLCRHQHPDGPVSPSKQSPNPLYLLYPSLPERQLHHCSLHCLLHSLSVSRLLASRPPASRYFCRRLVQPDPGEVSQKLTWPCLGNVCTLFSVAISLTDFISPSVDLDLTDAVRMRCFQFKTRNTHFPSAELRRAEVRRSSGFGFGFSGLFFFFAGAPFPISSMAA